MLKGSVSRTAWLVGRIGMMSLGFVCCISWAQDTRPGPADASLAGSPKQSQALDLSTAWRRAQQHDYSYQAAISERAAAFEALYLLQEGTRTEAQETLARLAVARAEAIQVMDDMIVALRELRALTGVAPTRMTALKDDFPVVPLTPSNLGEWLDRARVGSTQVLSSRQALLVADAEVDSAASDYLPYMDLVATYSKSDSENLSALSQRSNSFVIGIQVNITLFAGGYTRANVARARLDRMRLQYQLNAAIERNQAEVTREYTRVSGGAQRIEALQTAARSARASLEAASWGFVLGEVGNLEVLKVQDTLYHARYELIKAQLEYLLARLRLAAAVGALNSSHFDIINDAYLGRVIAVAGDNRANTSLVGLGVTR